MILAGMWRYRSFALAIAAALVLSPIVWLDYFALAALPLALARPRLSAIWFLPIATWGLEGAGLGIGDVVRHRPPPRRLRLVVLAVAFSTAEPCARGDARARDVTSPSGARSDRSIIGDMTSSLARSYHSPRLGSGLATFAGQDRLALDFHHGALPAGAGGCAWTGCVPAARCDLSDGTNAIWPMAAVLPASSR